MLFDILMETLDDLVDGCWNVFEVPNSVEVLIECIRRPFIIAQCIKSSVQTILRDSSLTTQSCQQEYLRSFMKSKGTKIL